jgi:hypothetical protein
VSVEHPARRRGRALGTRPRGYRGQHSSQVIVEAALKGG